MNTTLEECMKCNGTGLVKDYQICPRCSGNGNVKWTQNVLKRNSVAVMTMNDIINNMSSKLAEDIEKSILEDLKKENKITTGS